MLVLFFILLCSLNASAQEHNFQSKSRSLRKVQAHGSLHKVNVVLEPRAHHDELSEGGVMSLAPLDGRLYFRSENLAVGKELFHYDEATDSISLDTDINPGPSPANSFPSSLTVINDKLYFAAEDGVTGSELWLHDGATASLQADIYPGLIGTTGVPNSSGPSAFIEYNGLIYFSALDGTPGGLFSFDGTTVTKVSGIGIINGEMHVFNGKLFFFALGKLYSYDGSSVTLEVDRSVLVGELESLNGNLYFSVFDVTSGVELWSFDGVSASLVADIRPGFSSSFPGELTVFNDKLYFLADDGTHGFELWSYDGSTASLVQDINPGPDRSDPNGLTVFDGKLWFAANDGTTGEELWSHDGSSTGLFEDIFEGFPSSSPSDFALLGDRLYFFAFDGATSLFYLTPGGLGNSTSPVSSPTASPTLATPSPTASPATPSPPTCNSIFSGLWAAVTRRGGGED